MEPDGMDLLRKTRLPQWLPVYAKPGSMWISEPARQVRRPSSVGHVSKRRTETATASTDPSDGPPMPKGPLRRTSAKRHQSVSWLSVRSQISSIPGRRTTCSFPVLHWCPCGRFGFNYSIYRCPAAARINEAVEKFQLLWLHIHEED